MDDIAGIASVAEFLTRIRQGMAPRALRLFAAQGMLPVSREDLIRLLVMLAADSDPEISESAETTLSTFTVAQLQAVLSVPEVEPLELDLIARCRHDAGLWNAIARHPKAANETLRWLARVGEPRTQDVIVTNQVRLQSCLEILEDLRANPRASQDVLRRVREFEEEFLEKATVWAATNQPAEPLEPMPSIDEALADLKAIGMKVPGGEVPSAEFPEPEIGAPQELRDACAQLSVLNIHERIMRALKGTRQERMILVRDPSVLVVRAVVQSPKLTEGEVERIAGMRSANEEALRVIGGNRRWVRRYSVARALVCNPKTPTAIALQLVRRLAQRDLGIISRDRNVPEVVRRAAHVQRDHLG
jgi:hypothetical protein